MDFVPEPAHPSGVRWLLLLAALPACYQRESRIDKPWVEVLAPQREQDMKAKLKLLPEDATQADVRSVLGEPSERADGIPCRDDLGAVRACSEWRYFIPGGPTLVVRFRYFISQAKLEQYAWVQTAATTP